VQIIVAWVVAGGPFESVNNDKMSERGFNISSRLLLSPSLRGEYPIPEKQPSRFFRVIKVKLHC
jgi:hypothetical protein